MDRQSSNVPFLFSNDGTHSCNNGSFILFDSDESRTSSEGDTEMSMESSNPTCKERSMD